MNFIQKQEKFRAAHRGSRLYMHDLVDCPVMDYDSRELITQLVRLPAGRIARKLHANGSLRQFEGELPQGHQLRSIGAQIMMVPTGIVDLDERPIGTHDSRYAEKRAQIKEDQRNKVTRFFDQAIARPYIKLVEITFERDVEPTLTLSINYRTTLHGEITLPRNWKDAFELSNEKFVVISIQETEIVSDDVTIYRARAWSKESIRKAAPEVENVWVGKGGSTTSITKSRSTALRGASIRAKNEIVRQIW